MAIATTAWTMFTYPATLTTDPTSLALMTPKAPEI